MKGFACACTLACTLTVLVMGKIVNYDSQLFDLLVRCCDSTWRDSLCDAGLWDDSWQRST